MLKRLAGTNRAIVTLVMGHGDDHSSEDGVVSVSGVQLILAEETVTSGESTKLRSR
jgi:hypothetical protein